MEGISFAKSPFCDNKKKAKKKDDSSPDPSNEGNLQHDLLDQEQEVRWDSGSSTLNNEDDEAEERQQCLSGFLESANARKAAKAERKAAKNQVLFEVITKEELAMIEGALHPESNEQESTVPNGQGLANNHIIDENIAFNAHTFRWSKPRQGVHSKKLAKNNGNKTKSSTLEQDNKILEPILAQLGISTISPKANRERKSLDAKLRAAILGDLVAFENDQVETMQRMAGYWRYANKRVYNEMVRNNELWDWATGEKLPEIKEEAELDANEEQDENLENGTLVAETERQIPENWDDADYELLAHKALLPLNTPVDRSNTNRMASRSDTPRKKLHKDGDPKLSDEVYVSADHMMISSKGLSPISSDELQGHFQTESKDQLEEDAETLTGSPPRSSLSAVSSETGFQGVKDTRVFGKTVRPASPPLKDPLCSLQSGLTLSLPVVQKKDVADPLNRFGTLDNEVPAPREEVKKVEQPPVSSLYKIPSKPIVKTLAIHDEQDNWTTMQRPKGKKATKTSAKVTVRTRR